jgi:hypothetical protein
MTRGYVQNAAKGGSSEGILILKVPTLWMGKEI